MIYLQFKEILDVKKKERKTHSCKRRNDRTALPDVLTAVTSLKDSSTHGTAGGSFRDAVLTGPTGQ